MTIIKTKRNSLRIRNPSRVIIQNNNTNINTGVRQAINYNYNNNGGQAVNSNTNSIVMNERTEDSIRVTGDDAWATTGNTTQTDLAARPCHWTRGVEFPPMELVGQAFKTKNKDIWSLLEADKVTKIGVWGMGGVGKTTLVKNLHNQILKSEHIFFHVYWVSVTHDYETYKLQDLVANVIEFKLSKEDGVDIRGAQLFAKLSEKKNFVLILDDLWKPFDVTEVGIPLGKNGGKMIFTTRSRDVCRGMLVDDKDLIKLEPLSKKEAWLLFAKDLGSYKTGLEGLAKQVASKCGGLPLALKTVARSMREVHDESEWRTALKELPAAEETNVGMEKVFQILRYSYDRLNDLTEQECLLCCALFPKDFEIRREELIECLIVEGIIKGKKSWQEKRDKGHTILNKLENVCLLERVVHRHKRLKHCLDNYGIRYVKMHDLIRDMAIQKLKERYSIMVEAGAQLREVPGMGEWTQHLVRVSLISNYIQEIPSDHSPRCPELSTLLLRSNRELRLIADSFFKQLDGLKVLDLSNTGIVELPDSISELVSLITLSLSRCSNLKYIPSVAKLTKLQKLDLNKTGLEKLPKGMESLSNLTYLNLKESMVSKLSGGILPYLSHLQVLILDEVTGKVVACLEKLESLKCCFEGLSDFTECKKKLSSCTYNIGIGRFHISDACNPIIEEYSESLESKRTVRLSDCHTITGQDFKVLHEDIEVLTVRDCSFPQITLFGYDSLSLRCSTELKYICLKKCDGITALASLHCPSSFTTFLRKDAALQSPFSRLMHLDIYSCHGMKSLFPPGLMSTLKNLEILTVYDCRAMEVLEATEEDANEEEESRRRKQNGSSSHSLEFSLPELKILQLTDLPKLKSICSGVMSCNSLREIEILKCPELKRIPLSWPLPSLQKFSAYPKEWWDKVKWDQLPDKNQ